MKDKLVHNAPIKIPIKARGPKINKAASEIPEGGQIIVPNSLGIPMKLQKFALRK
jgi:hypothetical protein